VIEYKFPNNGPVLLVHWTELLDPHGEIKDVIGLYKRLFGEPDLQPVSRNVDTRIYNEVTT